MWHVECCVAARRWLRKRRCWRTVFWLFLQGVIQKEADREKSLCCQKADGEPLFRVVISALFTIWQVSPPSPHLLPPLASPSLINLDWVAWSTCQRLLINLWHLRVPETDSASRLRGFHRVSHVGSEEERSARLRWKKWDFRGQNENAKRLDAVSMATEVQHVSRLSVVIKMEETLKRSCQYTENKAESRIHQRNRWWFTVRVEVY